MSNPTFDTTSVDPSTAVRPLSYQQYDLLQQRVERLQKQLARAYEARACRGYGEHGWHYCACGREACPDGVFYCAHCYPRYPLGSGAVEEVS